MKKKGGKRVYMKLQNKDNKAAYFLQLQSMELIMVLKNLKEERKKLKI